MLYWANTSKPSDTSKPSRSIVTDLDTSNRWTPVIIWLVSEVGTVLLFFSILELCILYSSCLYYYN